MALTKPSDSNRWCSVTTGNRVQPDAAHLNDGWAPAEAPPAQYFNYLNGVTGDWLAWIDERIDDGGSPETTIYTAEQTAILQAKTTGTTSVLGATFTAGGPVEITGGAPTTPATGTSGSVLISTQDAQTVGTITLLAGQHLTGTGAAIFVTGGFTDPAANSTSTGGNVTIEAGSATTLSTGVATGGALRLKSGSGNAAVALVSHPAGDVFIETGTTRGVGASAIYLRTTDSGVLPSTVNVVKDRVIVNAQRTEVRRPIWMYDSSSATSEQTNGQLVMSFVVEGATPVSVGDVVVATAFTDFSVTTIATGLTPYVGIALENGTAGARIRVAIGGVVVVANKSGSTTLTRGLFVKPDQTNNIVGAASYDEAIGVLLQPISPASTGYMRLYR